MNAFPTQRWKVHRRLLTRAHLLAALAWLAVWPAMRVQGTEVTIGVIGDYGSAYLGGASFSNVLKVANLIKSWNPNFIITTGDNNYPDGEASNIDTNIGQFFHEYIHPYLGTYGPGGTTNRFWPSIGNHEWPFGVSFLAPYLAYFTLPGNERYYSHRHGPVEVFACVGDQQDPDGAVPGSIQAQWLSNALAQSTAPWRVVYFHASPYSSSATHGTHTHEADNMLWSFASWGASAIYTGHNHQYERVLTNGLNYVTIGLGGGRIDGFVTPIAGSVARYNATYGAVRLTVTETNFISDFFNIFGEKIDSYTLQAVPARLALRWENGQPSLQFTGTAGHPYILEASTNLVHWTPVSTNRLISVSTNLGNYNLGGQPTRFYRASNWR
jgi:tartrate-resistant acid phosphatase type 5